MSSLRLPPLCQLYDIALGLNYLHTEDIVHGDLRGVRKTCEKYRLFL